MNPLSTEIETLRAQLAAMTLRAERAEHERSEFKKLYLLVTYELERLKRQLFGKKAETVDPAQVQLAFGPVLEALERARTGSDAERTEVEAQLESLRARARAEVERRKADAKPRSRHGRRDLALEDLPVETIVLDPPERIATGGDKLVKIGVEESEHVDYRAASLVRVRVIRNKYRLPGDAAAEQPIVIAPVPERPIAKGMAGPGLLAHVLVSKFADHLPLHRQESIFRRVGLRLPRSTLCGWVQGSVTLLGRVVEAMWEDAKKTARWIGTDATGALVLAKDQCRRNHFWVVVAERDHVLFRFTKTHDGAVPAKLFEGFRGYLLADASAVYHELYRQEPGVTEVGCWAHARRKLFDALASDEARALVGIGFIGLLYDAHRLATDPKTGLTDGARRRAEAAPVIDRLYAWIAAERPLVSGDAPIAKALNYIVNHRGPLTRFLDDGLLRMDNNPSELQLRREVVGRKNWLFCGSDEGAHWNTVAVSLIASCQLHGIEPWAYLRDVLTVLPAWTANRVLELAPKYWNETSQKPHTQQLLVSLRLLGRTSSHAPETTPAT